MIRGEIWMVDFGVPFGSEPGWRRPVIVVQNDDFPGNMLLLSSETGLKKDSVAVTPQITVIDKARLIEKVCSLSDDFMQQCNENMCLLLDI